MRIYQCTLVPRLRGGLLVLLGWLLAAGTAVGQPDSLGSMARKLEQYEQRGRQEKLFLHLDRPLYLSGETMWFKIYAADATYARPLALSSVAYVEVLDARQTPVLQGKIPLKNAAGHGSFELPRSLASGTYTVRAYTSWMRNFGPDSYFHGTVAIVNTFTTAGAATASPDSVALDAQFFPEGGHLVKGLLSKIAFKVTDQTGKGLAAEGRILDPAGQVVATFQTLRMGMGSFLLTPTAATAGYTAVLTVAGRHVIRRKLPPVHEQGYVMRLTSRAPGQLTLAVHATATQPETILLLAHSGQKIVVAARAQLLNGYCAFVLREELLLEGVTHLTIFNARQQPLCERLYFRPPAQQLAIQGRPDKARYAPRSRVSLHLAPAAPASLSLAVYRLDSLSAAAPVSAIGPYLWLTSELKGTIENPGYYFTSPSPERAAATDNLMLTQGWSRFRWEEVLTSAPRPFRYFPEPKNLTIQGKLTQAGSGLPRPGVLTYLSVPGRQVRLSNARSDADGLIQFEIPPVYGPQALVAQTDPRQDSTCRITLFSPFSEQYAAAPVPALQLAPHLQSDYARRHLHAQLQASYFARYHQPAPLPATDSAAFYGVPNEVYFLDRYTRFKVLEEVLREYVPGVVVRIRKGGFHFLVANKQNRALLLKDPLVLLDGVPVFDTNQMMAMDPFKIQKLEVVDDRFLHGRVVHNGIVSFTTYKGDLEGFQLDPRVLVQEYEGLQVPREFYAPRYDTPRQQQSRLPDLRNLLYWNPDITATGPADSPIEFFTGDQAGRYLVVVQGLSATGLAGSTSFTFEVTPAL